MDILFSELKKKDVILLATGKKLGKIKDATITARGEVISFTVGGGIFFSSNEQTFCFSDIEKFGEDTLLIRRTQKQGEKCETKRRPCPPRPTPCPPRQPHYPSQPSPFSSTSQSRENEFSAFEQGGRNASSRADGFPRLDDDDYE